MDLEIIFELSESQISNLEEWLVKGQKARKSVFYSNWDLISKCIEENRIISVSAKGKVVAFLIWDEMDLSVYIKICEVKPTLRRKGIGRMLVEKSLAHFKSNRSMAIYLDSKTSSSEIFWRQCGFIDFPWQKNRGIFEGESVRLYKNLYEKKEIVNVYDEVIEIWKKAPQSIHNKNADWTCLVRYRDNEHNLEIPIIQPCQQDWIIRWRKGDEIIEERKAKYFQNATLLFGDFAILQKLLLPTVE